MLKFWGKNQAAVALSSAETDLGAVNNIPPIQENSMKNWYDENNGYDESSENEV